MGARDADPTGRRAGDPGGGGGAVLHRRAEVELLDRRACRLGAEAVEEGLGLQDLGRRAGHGLAARVDAREVPLHDLRRRCGRHDQQGHGQAREPALRREGRPAQQLLRRNPPLRDRRDGQRRDSAGTGRDGAEPAGRSGGLPAAAGITVQRRSRQRAQ
jgi:hypothetical protein